MMMGSFFFKNKARAALKGNWQNALVVTFFAGILLTVAQVMQSIVMQDISGLLSSLSYALQSMPEGLTTESTQYHEVMDLYNRLFSAIGSVPQSTWIALLAVNVAALVVTPMLTLSCNRYFIALADGEELGVKEGLLGRARIFLRALWLHVIMFVKIFLWSLLFVIPGIVAAVRYAMAPYYMAEDPSLTARQAIRKSKEAMKHMKMSYFMLEISFIGWNLLVSVAQMLLSGISPVVAMVAAQFLSLAVTAYLNASCAAFYCAVSRDGGVEQLVHDAHATLNRMGMNSDSFNPDGGDDDLSDGGDDE